MSSHAEIAKKLAADIHATDEGPEGEFSLRDIAITGLEGGINYWGYVEHYAPDHATTWATVTEEESSTDGPAKSVVLDVTSMRRGLASAITERLDAGWSIPKCSEFFITNVDADAADVVIQHALFGELVYA